MAKEAAKATELAITYDPAAMEERLYREWEEKGYFRANVDTERTPFTIVIPPPNITGQLHMGHALDNTIQDIIIRFKRMQGYNTLWQPGTDHASIATELRIMQKLREEGTSKEELGREAFLERAWAWKKEYGSVIIEQLKKLGSSCDWERERFTMDDGCNRAVLTFFCALYERGVIYRGSKMINWCPVCNTSISDAEVLHVEQNTKLWQLKYPLVKNDGSVSEDEFIVFATTRPETILGDTAVAVNPKDERYRHLVGRKVYIPLQERTILIVADDYVDPEFGTGVVKITPSHDPNDYEVAKRCNLPELCILNDDATINQNGGQLAGFTREKARREVVADFERRGLLVKATDYTHNVGTHDRCGTTIEPMVKPQWFVRMEEMIKPAVEAVKSGDVKLVPPRMDKLFYSWTDNIRDWCISRQLWWGHRIPAYYCSGCGLINVEMTAPSVCKGCNSTDLSQDPDTLDTWFSSALWPFSTLGWPQETEDLSYFYPTSVLVTGYDILFFWVIRMMVSGYDQMGQKPFDTVLLHGLIRDEKGRKMSKSLGNGIDPLDIIAKYGSDALRFMLVTGNAPGHDMRFSLAKVEASRNFANKLWNAARFIMMKTAANDGKPPAVSSENDTTLSLPDRWILHAANRLTVEVTAHLEHYELGLAAQAIYDFLWDDYCDWYIELAKLGGGAALRPVMTTLLKLLHPFMPFITEEIYRVLYSDEESLMISSWAISDEKYVCIEAERDIELLKEAIRAIRNIRAEENVAADLRPEIHIIAKSAEVEAVFAQNEAAIITLAKAGNVFIEDMETLVPQDAVSVVTKAGVIYIPLTELVNAERERLRLSEEAKRLSAELARAEKQLANPNFVAKAPPEKVASEHEKLLMYRQMMEQVNLRLQQLEDLD
ncbi:MAG: valine--tRNA ligase [Lachnospiraceae bacterium]|jgi:valyl-tRNA synthetase|nr:valine--tRNA ligase [Lachnospiraceae bacterium]